MVRIDDSSERVKCWLNYPNEVEKIERAARDADWEREVAITLMSRVGSRVSGVQSMQPSGVSYDSDGEYWKIEVKGKNTKGGEKTTRDAYLPQRVKEMLDRYESERDIRSNEPYVSASVPSIRRWVSEAAEEVAEEIENERWYHVSSHDLRRSWATYHLVEEDVPVRIMMSIGGWSSYDAIEPYLTVPSPEKIGEAMNELH